MTQTVAEIIIFKKHGGVLSKRLHLDAAGKLENDSSECRMATGVAVRSVLGSIGEFAEFIDACPLDFALALGQLKGAGGGAVPVVTKRQLRAGVSATAISRSQEFIEYRKGVPGFLLLDYDTKGMPDDVKRRLDDAGGFRAAIETLIPSLKGVATIERASTSSGLYRTDIGAEIPGSNGVHLYLWVRDVADSTRFLKALHARAWLAGFGWYLVGAAGQLLERSIVDRMVGQPERLVFEGAPVLDPPLAQDQAKRHCIVQDGEMLDTMSACPSLDAAEQARFDQMRAAARHALRGTSEHAREEFVTRQARAIAKRCAIPEAAARKFALDWSRGVLLPQVVLEFDDPDLAGTTAGDVLADPDKFIGETLADPLEGISYGRCKALVMRRDDGSLFIHSFAHGRGIYELAPDVAFIRAQLASLTGSDLVKAFAGLLACARLEAVEEAELIEWVSATAGIGKMVVKQQLKNARAAAAQIRAQAAQAHQLATRTDPRTRMRAPCDDAPWLPEMQAYEAVLLKIKSGLPPTRDMDLNLNTLWLTEIPGTHAYSCKGAGEPPAPQLHLARLSQNETANLLETHIDFYKETERGFVSVKCPMPYVEHFVKWDGSAMPMLVAFSQLPLVLADGEFLAPRGLDKLRGIAFVVDDELRARLPSSRVRDDAAVAEALDFLLNDWLVDISCSFADKLNLLALAATIIERSLLPERPVWFVTSPTPESGKTTAVKMVIGAVTGLDAVAFAWSPHDEERRKAILAYLDAGLSHILLDNILDGSVIQCPHVERACTANFYGDRKLGVSEHIRTSAATVFIFTGNNIEPAGAMASRTLKVRVDTDLVDPMARTFKRPYPVAWTKTNRETILAAIYTILLGNPMLDAAAGAATKTRFPMWYRLVGSAFEHAAKCYGQAYPQDASAVELDFEATFKKQKATEQEGVGLSEMLEAIEPTLDAYYKFNCAVKTKGLAANEFTSRELAACLNQYRMSADATVVRGFLFQKVEPHIKVSPIAVGRALAPHLDKWRKTESGKIRICTRVGHSKLVAYRIERVDDAA
jgi:hypothetical protein